MSSRTNYETMKQQIANEVRAAKLKMKLAKQKLEETEKQAKAEKIDRITRLERELREMQKEKYTQSLNTSLQNSSQASFVIEKDSVSERDYKSLTLPRTLSKSLSPTKSPKKNLPTPQYDLQQIKEIISRDNQCLFQIDESPKLDAKALKSLSQERVPLKVPSLVPLSNLRRSNNLPPPVVNHQTVSGEVIPVYLVGKPSPAHDPLIPVETKLYKEQLTSPKESVKAKAFTHRGNGISMNYYEKLRAKKLRNKINQKNFFEKSLTKAPVEKNPKPKTPVLKDYCFRDLEYDKPKSKSPQRKWVLDRMKAYYDKRVKADFVPVPDINKQLELMKIKMTTLR